MSAPRPFLTDLAFMAARAASTQVNNRRQFNDKAHQVLNRPSGKSFMLCVQKQDDTDEVRELERLERKFNISDF